MLTLTITQSRRQPGFVAFYIQGSCLGMYKASTGAFIFMPDCKEAFLFCVKEFAKSYPDIFLSKKPPEKVIKMKVDL